MKCIVYLYSFVLNLVLFFVNIVNNLKLVAGFTFIPFSLCLACNSDMHNSKEMLNASSETSVESDQTRHILQILVLLLQNNVIFYLPKLFKIISKGVF